MHLCYIDEAGNGQTIDPARPDAPPVLVVGGFTVPRSHVKSLTWAFLDVKKHYRPQLRSAEQLSEVIQEGLAFDESGVYPAPERPQPEPDGGLPLVP
ncbi:DUF3800 domain-containing protein [Streptomyces sp. NPDC057245]|uniref:DUF3800 domain-containing protein n=1 Tax=Streptomyces TaxID=1883 RepID=UPI001C1E41C7|nr:DUF3800 domain-containing protein [Streptomyces sp. A108]MBU6533071.1 hypothetical protein [Streptomyces sp. A108]